MFKKEAHLIDPKTAQEINRQFRSSDCPNVYEIYCNSISQSESEWDCATFIEFLRAGGHWTGLMREMDTERGLARERENKFVTDDFTSSYHTGALAKVLGIDYSAKFWVIIRRVFDYLINEKKRPSYEFFERILGSENHEETDLLDYLVLRPELLEAHGLVILVVKSNKTENFELVKREQFEVTHFRVAPVPLETFRDLPIKISKEYFARRLISSEVRVQDVSLESIHDGFVVPNAKDIVEGLDASSAESRRKFGQRCLDRHFGRI